MRINPAVELEVIKTLLAYGSLEKMAAKKALLTLEEQHFYVSLYRNMFKVIKKLAENNEVFDAVTIAGSNVYDDMKELAYASMQNEYISENMFFVYIEQLKELHCLRQQVSIVASGLVECNKEVIAKNASSILCQSIRKAQEYSISNKQNLKTFGEVRAERLAGLYDNEQEVQCGIRQFTKVPNSSLITIAGASGIGKTFFSIYVMHEIARFQRDKQVLFFSLEMTNNQITSRYEHLVAHQYDKMVYGKILDTPMLSIEDIETIAINEATQRPISVIVVDYLSLVTNKAKFESEHLRLGEVAKRLAALAINLKCIVIGLSQVNRDPAKRQQDDRCPYTHDVADSQASVRSSSLWFGIDQPPNMPNTFVAKCRKSRNSELFDAWFDFNGGRFTEKHKPYSLPQKKQSIDELFGGF